MKIESVNFQGGMQSLHSAVQYLINSLVSDATPDEQRAQAVAAYRYLAIGLEELTDFENEQK